MTSVAEDGVNPQNSSDAQCSTLGSLPFMQLGTLAYYYKSEIASLMKNIYADTCLT
jgi:hypothetical protein